MAQIIPLYTSRDQLSSYVVSRLTNVAWEIAKEYSLRPEFVAKFRSIAQIDFRNDIPANLTLAEAAAFCDKAQTRWRTSILRGLRHN